MRPSRHLAAAALLATVASAAQAAPAVIASIKPVHSLVAGVMEGVGTPHLMLDAAQTPHSFALSPSDAARIAGADLVVWVGPDLESFLVRPIASTAPEGASMELARTEGILRLPVRDGGVWEAHDHDHAHETASTGQGGHDHAEHGHDGHDHDGHDHGEHEADAAAEAGHDHAGAGEIDPHIWLDPANGRVLARAIAVRLAAIDPQNAARYAANAEAVAERIHAAERAAADRLAGVTDRPFMVLHDAYQYFEAHFGLSAIGAITLSPERKPGARRIVEIRERIVTAGAPCLFREPQFPPALVDTVVEGTEARVGVLDPLGVEIPAGPGAYPALIEAIAGSLADCLAAGS